MGTPTNSMVIVATSTIAMDSNLLWPNLHMASFCPGLLCPVHTSMCNHQLFPPRFMLRMPRVPSLLATITSVFLITLLSLDPLCEDVFLAITSMLLLWTLPGKKFTSR